MIVYVVCEIGHEDSGTVQEIELVTLDRGEAERLVKRLGDAGHYVAEYEVDDTPLVAELERRIDGAFKEAERYRELYLLDHPEKQ